MLWRLAVRALALGLALLAAPAYGQGLIHGTPADEETITVGAAAIGVTDTVCRSNAGDVTSARVGAMIQVKGTAIFFALHSAAATPDSGDFDGFPGDILILNGSSVQKLRMIRATAVDATVKVQCFQ